MTENDDDFRPHLTIVGGQPRKMRQKQTVKVPVGMEKVLFLASKDEEFKKKLLDNRQAAIEESGVQLRPSEEATFKVISNAALETMIANIVPENPRRRKFMGLVAAAAASLAAGTVETGCVSGETRGIGPDDEVDGGDDTVDSAGTDTAVWGDTADDDIDGGVDDFDSGTSDK